MGTIYKITNKINQKIYIGQTTKTIEERFIEHYHDCPRFKHRPLYKEMVEYGIENFEIEIIEIVPDDYLLEREIYWIKTLNTFIVDENSIGYNSTRGGSGKLVYDTSKILKRLRENPYPKELAEEFGCSSDLIRLIAENNDIEVKSRGQEYFKDRSKPIGQFTNNTLIHEFGSATEAACKLFNDERKRNHIIEVANNKRKSAYGFNWKWL